MKQLKQVWQYIKDNKLYLAIMLIGSIMFILQMKEVILYADDFSLGIISKGGFSEIFKYFIGNYMSWGGGNTCLIATTFLMFRIGVWKVFQCIIVIATVILATRIIAYTEKKYKPLVAGVIWLCLYILSIWVSREVLYWLDGGLAYELTAFIIFAYFYYLYSRMILNINKKYDKVLLPIIAFFAGWSGAQTGFFTLVMPFMFIIWQRFIKKEKISKLYYITTVIGIVGFAIYYFAPGNNARMVYAFEEFANYNLIQKIMCRVKDVYGLIFDFKNSAFMSIPFYILFLMGLNAGVGLKLFSEEENKIQKILAYTTSIIQIVFMILCLGTTLNIPYSGVISNLTINFSNLLYAHRDGTLTLQMFIPYVVTTIVMLSIVVEAYLICLKNKDPFLVIIVISALIMHGVMVMAPYSPYRTTYYTIMFLWFAIAYLIKQSYTNKNNIAMILILILMLYNYQLSIMLLISYLFVKNCFVVNSDNRAKFEIVTVIVIMIGLAISNYKITIQNYAINKEVYLENIRRIEEYKENKQNGIQADELYLLLPEDEIYGFTPMVGIEWVEEDIKKYFDLGDVTLKTEQVEESTSD